MESLCALTAGVVIVAVVGHLLWMAAAGILGAVFGPPGDPDRPREPRRTFRYCPACGSDTDERDLHCPQCELSLDSRRARDLNRVRIAEREVRALVEHAKLDRDEAGAVLDQLEARARSLQGLPMTKPGARPRAKPVAPVPTEAEPVAPAALAPVEATEVLPAPDAEAKATPEPLATPASPPPVEPSEPPAVAALAHVDAPAESHAPETTPAPIEPEPPPPKRRLSDFLEEHNILWGELVGGLLIVGCSIALLVTLWRQLEEIRYFPFALSAGVTLALFGAGQYTLHRWKLAGTSRGILVISMLLTPLTLLLLSEPVAHGTGDALDIGIKLAAIAAFVGIVRTGGRDLIGTEHLPGPIDRRWLLSLAVVGAAASQLLPTAMSSAWLPTLCFVVATGATLGGLSWYHPGRREEPVADRTGTALVMFTGLAVFALLAAWGLYLVRDQASFAARLRDLAIPLALAAVPVVEAGVLVLRRVPSAGLRTTGTGVALVGFLGMTTALALAWPDPLALLIVSAATGAFLTRAAFREQLVWVQIGAIPLIAFATVLGFHGLSGSWTVPATTSPSAWLRAWLDSSGTGAVLVGFALALAGAAELLARRPSRQSFGYALGGLVVGSFGLVLLSTHGIDYPAPAAIAHAAAAVGMLAANARWKRRAVAHGGLWLALAATLWGLWAVVPRQPDKWGFVVAVEALVLAAGAVALRGTRGKTAALLRRAARDVSFGACVLAVAIALTSNTLRSDWHTGMLFALALTGVSLARLTGAAPLTWAGSLVALLGFAHLALHTLHGEPQTLALEAAVLTHATLATLAAVACRRQGRVFGDPLRWSARLSSALAVPLLFYPPLGLAYVTALLAVWLGVLWLAFVLLWKERGAFSAFQAAITLAALLVAYGWVEQQPWWATTPLRRTDPRALYAFGLALGALAFVWTSARRALRAVPTARRLWCDNPLSLDRIVLGAAVTAFLFFAVIAVIPGVRAELTPLGSALPVVAPPELTHAFDVVGFVLFAVLLVAVVYSWFTTTIERDAEPHVLGLALLLFAPVVLWAGSHESHVAAASALRWGLAFAFAAGTVAVALRGPLRRLGEATGFPTQPSPRLRWGLLALLATAAGVVILLSAQVAELGLNRITARGPDERSVFALMGALPSNLVPLALVVFALALSAARERSSGYALSGGLVFVGTLTAGYALAVTVAGKPLDVTEQVRLILIAASSAAVWAIAWLAAERRVPGGIPLVVQVSLGFVVLGLLCTVTALRVFARPADPLPAALDPLAHFGWLALALVAGAGFWHTQKAARPDFWHTRRDPRETQPFVFGFVVVVLGALLAAALREFDVPGWWQSFHALVLVWAAGALALLAIRRSHATHGVLGAFATLLVFCALRGAWHDPWRPWLPVGLALSAALVFGVVALRTQLGAFALASGLAVNFAAILVWIAYGPETASGCLLANAAGVAAATACWTLVRIRQGATTPNWFRALDTVPGLVLALLAVGLAPVLANTQPAGSLAWGATGVVALACAVGLWDRSARLAPWWLYATGVLAVLLAAVALDPRPVWAAPLAPLGLGAFALGTVCAALALSKRTNPVLGMPDRGDSWSWLVPATAVVGVLAGAIGMRVGLTAPDVLERLAFPLTAALFALTFAVAVRVSPGAFREPLQTASAALGVVTLGALAWAIPNPAEPFAWLHRNAWLFVALAVAAVSGSEGAPLVGTDWLRARRRVAGFAAALAFGVLCLHLLQQVPVFNPATRRTPLTHEEAFAMLAAIALLFALALRFALKEDRDPLSLPAARRTVYVYGAEVLIVLFFTQIRLNVPELFFGELAKLWTFIVMALAYTGIGLAELFERKKLDVLAVPLRRTGVLLPLVPLVAFWAKPPAFVSEFAHHTAPGLGPFLGYLENLPQHFDTYAWLWFFAAGVYGLLALKRKSFGWALLGALATNAALWALLAHHQVPFVIHPQAWVIPLALIVLVSEHINRRRLSEEASNALRYGGIAMIYVASAADMFIAGVGNSVWLPVVLAVLCVAGVLAGIRLRVRAFIHLGVAFLFLDVFSMIWHAAVNLQHTWVWYASGIVLGVLVLGLFAYLEKRRTHAERVE